MTVPPSLRLAADPALPKRDMLLNLETMRATLSAALGLNAPASIAPPTLVRVNYQVGRSMRAVYTADIDGVTRTIAARMFARGKSADVYRRSLPGIKDRASLRGIAHDADAGTVFWVFPNDRKIASLDEVLDPSTPVPGVEARGPISKRLVAYAPEKSATLVCETAPKTPLAYAKVTAAHQAGRDYETYASLRAVLNPLDRTLCLPTPLGYSHHHRTLWLEAVRGRRMAESVDDDAEVADLQRLGAAVASFHGLSAPHAPRFDRFDPQHLADNATIIRTIRPDVGDAADELAARLITTHAADADVACLHGDLHPKNAILCPDERLALIDVEDVTIGPAAADIASLLASLVYRRETQRLSPAACRDRVVAFLTGYAAHRHLPSRSSLAWHTAAALFIERAARAVTRLRPLGLQHLPALFAAAERFLDRGLDEL
jgi:aminoglycoside phosphotransferase (APT) family kinase protein